MIKHHPPGFEGASQPKKGDTDTVYISPNWKRMRCDQMDGCVCECVCMCVSMSVISPNWKRMCRDQNNCVEAGGLIH